MLWKPMEYSEGVREEEANEDVNGDKRFRKYPDDVGGISECSYGGT